MSIRTAANKKKGVQLTKEYLPDVIVCDMIMPELGGFRVSEALSQDVQTNGTPIILLSAKTERKDVRKDMEQGADDYLAKPLEETKLIAAIENRLVKMVILKGENPERKPPSDTSIKSIHELKNYMDYNGQNQVLKMGETIYREGMYCNAVYLVIRGVVKTHKLDSKGKELITGIYKPNDFFGFGCFALNTTHNEYATAMEDTRLVAISAENLKSLLLKNQGLTMELMQFLSESLSKAKEQLLEMAYGSARRKAASTILKFAEKLQKNPMGNLPILRSDLASLAGMATETLIRTLSSFKKEGLIQIEGRNVRIVDVDLLSRVD